MKQLHIKNRVFKGRTARFLPVVLLAVIIAITSVAPSVMAKNNANNDTSNAKQQYVITIYDDNTEKTIISTADNATDALKSAEISVSKHDSVEPALDKKFQDAIVIINIHRARPVMIVDNQRQARVITSAQNTTDIANVANINLHPEDIASLSLPDDLLLSGGAGLQMNITRAKVVNLKLYGQDLVVRTQKNTVAELLKEKKIELGPDDGMSLAPETEIVDEMQLQIWRNGIQTVTATEEISFTTKTVQDATRNVGYHEIQTTGQNGEKTVIYQIEMRNGEEINRAIISEVVNQPAIEQVEIVGTKVNLPPGNHEDWMRMAGISPSDYGYVNYIFNRESGWRTSARNPSGKYVGLGQTNPATLAAACPNWQSDPICQIKFFDGYAKRRYGSWAGAYNFWQRNHWW